jgi:diacylglycerol kinase family enzyme
MTEPQNPALNAIREPWIAIQRNPKSGSGKRSRELLELIRGLRAQGFRPRMFSNRAELDRAVRHPESVAHLWGIVAAGGDGTLLDVINRHPRIPIAAFPMGTENLFARSIGASFDGAAAARMIAIGNKRRFDVGNANGRRFLVVGSAGFDAEVIRAAHENRVGRISRVFYLRPIAHALFRYPFPMMQVWLDGDPGPVQCVLAVVANLPGYALRLPILPSADGNDGLLDVCLWKTPGRRALIGDFINVILGRHQASANVIVRRARRIRIHSDASVPFQLDGDAAGNTPIEITVESAAIEMFVP